jgi:ribosomal protein S18 acetylase RimI-like enzyme
MLADAYKDSMDAIELGVHQSNAGARRLYEKLGFITVKQREDLGFQIMQKQLLRTRARAGA